MAGPNRLLTWRNKEDLTQQEASDRMGVDLASYNAFENGRERPGLEYAVAIELVTKGYVKPVHWIEAKRERARAS